MSARSPLTAASRQRSRLTARHVVNLSLCSQAAFDFLKLAGSRPYNGLTT